MDVGTNIGKVLGPLQRIVHYACQPEAPVDIIRSGLEDTPYRYDADSGMVLAENADLLEDVLREMRKYGYEPLVEKTEVHDRLHFDVLGQRHAADMALLSMAIEERLAA